MKTIIVSEASGKVLDWLVAKCLAEQLGKSYVKTKSGKLFINSPTNPAEPLNDWNPSTDWSQGGPIIAFEGISWHCGNKSNWHAYAYGQYQNFSGTSPLIAAMRCYVASKLGETTEVPDELL